METFNKNGRCDNPKCTCDPCTCDPCLCGTEPEPPKNNCGCGSEK